MYRRLNNLPGLLCKSVHDLITKIIWQFKLLTNQKTTVIQQLRSKYTSTHCFSISWPTYRCSAAPTAVQLRLLLFSCTYRYSATPNAVQLHYRCSAAATAVQLRLLLLSSEFQEIRRREGSTRVPWHRTVQSLESSESLSKVCAMLSTSWNVPTYRQAFRLSDETRACSAILSGTER
jgi:hypothetical protein